MSEWDSGEEERSSLAVLCGVMTSRPTLTVIANSSSTYLDLCHYLLCPISDGDGSRKSGVSWSLGEEARCRTDYLPSA